ncbi:MAG TPA: urease accessory UreF family protein, partial [Nitrosopumilus sp.]|nr:urease accessory UreF family protein [Nitrosopumilus sp.]
MNTDEINEELAVMQLSDSFFPTGLYATSNGLEFLFSNNEIKGIEDIKNMIMVNIEQQIGPSDCIALSNAFVNAEKKDFEKIIQVDEIAFIMKPIKEIRKASINSGIQLIKCVTEFVKDDEMLNEYQKAIKEKRIYGIFPVAFAICCNALKIKKEKSLTMLLYGFTVSVIGAALRLGLIQHLEGQKILHE